MKKIFFTLVGSLLIAIAFNLFFLQYDLVSSGIFGLGLLMNYHNHYDPALFILIANMGMLILSLITLGLNKTMEYTIPSMLIPILIIATHNIGDLIPFESLETILAAVVGAFLTGLGFSLLYKEGQSVGGIEILQDIANSIKDYRTKYLSYIIEAIILIAAFYILDVESMLYSLIAIVIIRTIAAKAKVGVSSSKTFFIITTREKEVKEYIINELNHDLTEFNVKGGFTNTKFKILMTAMDTREYFKLKEKILSIDPKAFITITDSYEVINKNMLLKSKRKIN